MYGVVTVEDIVFGEKSGMVVDPSEEKLKSDFEIEIDNIIDEFLLLEDSEEIISFIKENIDNIDDTKIFVNSVLNFYFNSTLSNFSKFKKDNQEKIRIFIDIIKGIK